MTHAQPQKKSFFNMNVDLMHGPILKSLLLFMLPILGALVLQAAYGAVDLLVVGRFGSTSGLSAVSTGSQVLNLVTFVVTQLSMGVTVLIARYLGEKKHEFISPVIGSAAVVFTLLAAVLFGPVEGFAVGAVADMIGGTLSGYAINPLITLGAGSIGLTAGLLWRALPNLRLGLRTQISVFAGHAVGSIVINSLALHLFYNYPWSVLVTRIPNALVLAAVNTVLVRLLLENKTIRGIAQ